MSMKAKILELLREKKEQVAAGAPESGVYVSGQELCEQFGVSRTAVWKAIGQLKKEGYVEGKNLKLDHENAQGDQSNLQTISTNLLSNNDLVLGIATPAAQTLSNLSSDVPVVFTAVTDPVSAKLVDTMETPNGIATGTSDMSPISKHVECVVLLQRSKG